MYQLLRFKSLDSLRVACDLFEEMAIDSRFGSPRSPNEPDALPHSTASAPSLRSRNSVYLPMARQNDGAAGSNVKVVVRVRDFLPRGKFIPSALSYNDWALMPG